MTQAKQTIRLGYAVGTGEPVDVPLAHTFVTGQTQVSGKTTTLQALVARSGRRALAFVTKRGEALEGRAIRPYLPREGDAAIHWRFVETIMASALGQRALKYERLQIINAARGARSLDDVRKNIARLLGKARSGSPAAGIYELLGEYLDLVLPEMRALDATHELDLRPGLNVMDLADASAEMQALAIGAAIGKVNDDEKQVLVVFPEAWQFAPRDRNTAAKFAAEKTSRLGSVLGNFLLCDSQDIVGVSPVVRGQSTVWIVGVQGEANELRRTLEVIKSKGIAAPRASAIATLGVGQFYACWGSHAIKTYVQPAWMSDADARAVAMGGGFPTPAGKPCEIIPEIIPDPAPVIERSSTPAADWPGRPYDDGQTYSHELSASTADPTEPDESEDDVSAAAETNEKLDRLIELMGARAEGVAGAAPPAQPGGAGAPYEDALYQRFRARLLKDAVVLKVMASTPVLEVSVERHAVTADGGTLLGRVALLIARGFLDEARTNIAIVNELGRTGGKTMAPRVSEALAKLKGMGFVSDEGNGWQAVKAMKKSIVEKK